MGVFVTLYDVVLLTFSALLLLTGYILFARPRYLSKHPLESDRKHFSEKSLSIVVPARNEEANLPKLFTSLKSYLALKNIEVILVNDSSTDRTAEIAASYGARVIQARPLEAGWTGKNWACFQGAQASQSDFLLFVDADVEFSPFSLEALFLELSSSSKKTALSVLPFHVVPTLAEQLSAFFNILMAMGTASFALIKKQSWMRLVGQSLFLERSVYFDVGGHESVKGYILENFYLSRLLHDKGVLCRSVLGKDYLKFRMYPDGYKQLVEGWSKAFVSGSQQIPAFIFGTSIVWMSSLMVVFLLVTGIFSLKASLLFYVIAAIQVAFFLKRIGSYSVLTAIFFPLPLMFYQALFFKSALGAKRGKNVSWKGRSLSSAIQKESDS